MPTTILLDTNVVSEMTRDAPDPLVTAWYLSQATKSLYTSSITLAEVLYGIALLPEGKRRTRLNLFAEKFFQTEMLGKIFVFDLAAAKEYGRIRALKRKLGTPMSPQDAQIAAIAAVAGASLATRNVDDFKHCGVPIINPWNASSKTQ